MKTVNLEDNIHKMLSEISEHKKNKGEIIRTKKDILADLVMGAHIRIMREVKRDKN